MTNPNSCCIAIYKRDSRTYIINILYTLCCIYSSSIFNYSMLFPPCYFRHLHLLSTILNQEPQFYTTNVAVSVGISLLSYLEAKVLHFLTYFRLISAILVSAWDTSLKSSRIAPPFGEHPMRKFQPVPKICEGGSTNVIHLGCSVEG